jgi:hypothetical protein
MKNEKPQVSWNQLIWATVIVLIFGAYVFTVVYGYTLRIEMDENTLKAVQNVSTTANEISIRQASEVKICQFQNVTLNNEKVMAVWFTGTKCSLLVNDNGKEFKGKKVKYEN